MVRFMHFCQIGAVLALATAGFADTITLKNGQIVNGTYLGGTARQVRVDLGDHVRTLDVPDIVRIEFSGPAPQEAATPPANPPALGVTLPVGTHFTIRMIDAVDSQTAHTGQTFAASLDEPVNDSNGNVVIPRGADVVVKLVNLQQSGKITGTTELALVLSSVRVNGQLEDVYTKTVSEKSANRSNRSAGTIGGGAIGGAILGGILGGGKGAAIGTAAGAATGAAVEMTTSGQRVRVPAESRLTFVLDNAVRI
jgi:outer membrane lipoprotein SlyB